MPVHNLKHLTFITSGSLSAHYSVGNKCLAKFESCKKSCQESVTFLKLTAHFISVTYLRHQARCVPNYRITVPSVEGNILSDLQILRRNNRQQRYLLRKCSQEKDCTFRFFLLSTLCKNRCYGKQPGSASVIANP